MVGGEQRKERTVMLMRCPAEHLIQGVAVSLA